MNTVFPPRPLAAVIALLCAASAGAQDLPTVTIRGAGGDEGLALDRPKTTASRLDISALDLPASAESLSAATIAARGGLLVKDAVTRSTGVTDSSSPGSGIGLHQLDFAFLRTRPVWDVVAIVLCVLGFALTFSGLVPGWRRLMKG